MNGDSTNEEKVVASQTATAPDERVSWPTTMGSKLVSLARANPQAVIPVFWIVLVAIILPLAAVFMILMVGSSNGPMLGIGVPVPIPVQPTATPLPPGSQVLCPVPGGTITCGSSRPNLTTYGNCPDGGHCVGNYPENQWCAQFSGTYYAADVSGSPGTDVYLPHLTIPGTGQAHALTCLFVGAYPGVADPSKDITQFNCVDRVDGRNYWLNFHHLRHGTGPSEFDRVRQTEFHSGEAVAGKIDQTHVHIQIGIGSPCGGFSPTSCVPADQYIKC